MGKDCPVCGKPYHDRTIVSVETRFHHSYPGAFFDFMSKYKRRCSSRKDVEVGEYVSRDEIVCYFHGT